MSASVVILITVFAIAVALFFGLLAGSPSYHNPFWLDDLERNMENKANQEASDE